MVRFKDVSLLVSIASPIAVLSLGYSQLFELLELVLGYQSTVGLGGGVLNGFS